MNRKHNKEGILQVGIELFREQGYHNTGTNEILRESKISRGSFYNFFKDKEDFGIQSLEHYGTSLIAQMNEILFNYDKSPLERIVALFEHFQEYYRNLNYAWGCFLGSMALEVGGVNRNFKAAIQNELSRIIDLLASCIAEGQAFKEIRTDKSPEDLAMQLWGNYNGALVLIQGGIYATPLQQFINDIPQQLK